MLLMIILYRARLGGCRMTEIAPRTVRTVETAVGAPDNYDENSNWRPINAFWHTVDREALNRVLGNYYC